MSQSSSKRPEDIYRPSENEWYPRLCAGVHPIHQVPIYAYFRSESKDKTKPIQWAANTLGKPREGVIKKFGNHMSDQMGNGWSTEIQQKLPEGFAEMTSRRKSDTIKLIVLDMYYGQQKLSSCEIWEQPGEVISSKKRKTVPKISNPKSKRPRPEEHENKDSTQVLKEWEDGMLTARILKNDTGTLESIQDTFQQAYGIVISKEDILNVTTCGAAAGVSPIRSATMAHITDFDPRLFTAESITALLQPIMKPGPGAGSTEVDLSSGTLKGSEEADRKNQQSTVADARSLPDTSEPLHRRLRRIKSSRSQLSASEAQDSQFTHPHVDLISGIEVAGQSSINFRISRNTQRPGSISSKRPPELSSLFGRNFEARNPSPQTQVEASLPRDSENATIDDPNALKYSVNSIPSIFRASPNTSRSSFIDGNFATPSTSLFGTPWNTQRKYFPSTITSFQAPSQRQPSNSALLPKKITPTHNSVNTVHHSLFNQIRRPASGESRDSTSDTIVSSASRAGWHFQQDKRPSRSSILGQNTQREQLNPSFQTFGFDRNIGSGLSSHQGVEDIQEIKDSLGRDPEIQQLPMLLDAVQPRGDQGTIVIAPKNNVASSGVDQERTTHGVTNNGVDTACSSITSELTRSETPHIQHSGQTATALRPLEIPPWVKRLSKDSIVSRLVPNRSVQKKGVVVDDIAGEKDTFGFAPGHFRIDRWP